MQTSKFEMAISKTVAIMFQFQYADDFLCK